MWDGRLGKRMVMRDLRVVRCGLCKIHKVVNIMRDFYGRGTWYSAEDFIAVMKYTIKKPTTYNEKYKCTA